MASMIVTSKNSYQVPLLVNYGFYGTEWTKEDQVKRMIVKPLERVLLQPKVMAGYAIDVVKNIKSPKAKENMEKDLDRASGVYWKKYQAALKNTVITYHRCLAELFLDEHVQKLLTRMFSGISKADAVSCHLPADIIAFGFGD